MHLECTLDEGRPVAVARLLHMQGGLWRAWWEGLISRGQFATQHVRCWLSGVCGIHGLTLLVFVRSRCRGITMRWTMRRTHTPTRGCQRDIFWEPRTNGDGSAVRLPTLIHIEMRGLRNSMSVSLVEHGCNYLRWAINLKHLESVTKSYCKRFVVQVFPSLAVGIVQNNILVVFS